MQEPFDFAFIDGAYTWDYGRLCLFPSREDASAGRVDPFDDLDWSYSKSPAALEKDFVRSLTDEEKNTAQTWAIWEKLVLQHPGFCNFVKDSGWGWAQKCVGESKPRRLEIKTTALSFPERLARKLFRRSLRQISH